MSLESTLPKLEQVERQIGERLRELRVLRSLRRILQRKYREDETAARNRKANQGVDHADSP